MPTVVSLGEVMIEIAPTQSTSKRSLSFAGDTYNTAICLARLGVASSYVTLLGDDAYSRQIIQQLEDESIDHSAISTVEGRVPGLYMINNTADGEREFLYWRDAAPAREMFNSNEFAESLRPHIEGADILYFSGITLAILPTAAREKLLEFLQQQKSSGSKVAFDSNYRPRLWKDKFEAQHFMKAAMSVADIALLTLDDEALLWGENAGTIAGCLDRYSGSNTSEFVFKRGAEDVVVILDGCETRIPVPVVSNIIDTTAAGDTFNAGYLAARSQNASVTEAAQQASRCANVIIRHRGGVIDKNLFLSELKLLEGNATTK
jgi:2-dehydro-3-deoxygluconokinase